MYVIMTQPGETDNYCALKHVEAIFEHAGRNIIDCRIVNKQKYPSICWKVPPTGRIRFINRDELAALGIKVVEGNFLRIEGEHLRHDYEKLAQTISACFKEVMSQMFLKTDVIIIVSLIAAARNYLPVFD